jgi:hypothetical protein
MDVWFLDQYNNNVAGEFFLKELSDQFLSFELFARK